MCQPFLLGAPLSAADRAEFEAAILNRFPGPAIEQAVVYADRITDRQINKARGLLSFNSVLFAVFAFHPDTFVMRPFGTLLTLVSSLMLVLLMYVSWAPAKDFVSAETDFRNSCRVCYRRAWILTVAIVLSLVSVGIASAPLVRSM